MKQMIELSQSEYQELKDAQMKLIALESAGVDNWQGYSEAMDLYKELKEKWDADFAKRKKIAAILATLIPEFSVRLGGATSIDVTKPGIDKAYGIKKLRDTLHLSLKEMVYIGDALFPGGNDYPAAEEGVVSIPVKGPDDTDLVIRAILACLGGK